MKFMQCSNHSNYRIDKASNCSNYILMLVKANWFNTQWKAWTKAYIMHHFYRSYRKASFSSSFNTSCWLFSLATSMGVLPSMFCKVLQKGRKKIEEKKESTHRHLAKKKVKKRKRKVTEGLISWLTQRHHSPAVEPHIPSFHNQLHNEVQYFCSCLKHPLLHQPQEGPEHTSPEMKLSASA